MPIDHSPDAFLSEPTPTRSQPEPEPLLSYSGKVGSTFNLSAQAVELTPGASSTCTGNACTCSSCCCW